VISVDKTKCLQSIVTISMKKALRGDANTACWLY